jgi:1-acyl-sn-glycerol-3-phosphate acyltransferase
MPAGKLPLRQERLVRWFVWYCQKFLLPKSFTAFRLAKAGPPPAPPPDVPLVVVCNHPSWWDPILCALLSPRWPHRADYCPIDSQALRAYPLLRRLGFFPVEPGSPSSAREFLETGAAILNSSDTALWITAQGQFTDPRRRPVELRAGLGHLLRRSGRCVVAPLALEYPFWNEKLPEALALFGDPIEVTSGKSRSAAEWMAAIAIGLSEAMDRLSALAQARDPEAFETVVEGRTGVGGVYDWIRQIWAACRGRTFHPGHDDGRRNA